MKKLEILAVPGIGYGVFTNEAITKSDVVLEFDGPLLSLAELESGSPYNLQIGDDLYIGPSGAIDDLVNHSCEPNCGVTVDGKTARLFALRSIEAGEEITFDYSTTSTEGTETWALKCTCGKPTCRKIVSGFWSVPEGRRAELVAAGAVPDYVLKSLEAPKDPSR